MPGLFISGVRVEVDPDNIPSIRNKRVPNHLKPLPPDGRTKIDFLMDVFIRNAGE
jgi:hypothetical protein